MRVLLIHNRNAGKGKYRRRDIACFIEEAGHLVRAVDKQDEDLERHLARPFDLVAIAGGDGTVHRVAELMLGHSTPFTILPLGTANNLAHSIGITGDPPALVQGWSEGTVLPFDALKVSHSGRDQVVFESVGLGLFTEAMCLAISHEDEAGKLSPKKRFDRDFRLLRKMVDTLPPVPCTIAVDGERGRRAAVVLCEVMNSRQIGSRLVLAPDASTSDGLLDLVLVTQRGRAQLRRFMHRDPSDDHPPHLPVRQVRQVQITSRAKRIHVADTIERSPARTTAWKISIEVLPAQLRVLIPKGATEEP
jgi:diacylglycerol kinase (ATP)